MGYKEPHETGHNVMRLLNVAQVIEQGWFGWDIFDHSPKTSRNMDGWLEHKAGLPFFGALFPSFSGERFRLVLGSSYTYPHWRFGCLAEVFTTYIGPLEIQLRAHVLFIKGISNYSEFHSGQIITTENTSFHSKWWFSKGHPLISGLTSRLVKYFNLARFHDLPQKMATSKVKCKLTQ